MPKTAPMDGHTKQKPYYIGMKKKISNYCAEASEEAKLSTHDILAILKHKCIRSRISKLFIM